MGILAPAATQYRQFTFNTVAQTNYKVNAFNQEATEDLGSLTKLFFGNDESGYPPNFYSPEPNIFEFADPWDRSIGTATGQKISPDEEDKFRNMYGDEYVDSQGLTAGNSHKSLFGLHICC